MNESKIINDYLKKLVINNNSSLNLNDDVFFDKSKKTVISVDTYIEGSHFIDFKKPELVMKKIIRSSISDLICKRCYLNIILLLALVIENLSVNLI